MAFRSPLLFSRFLILPTASAGLLLSFQRPSHTLFSPLGSRPLQCDAPRTAFTGRRSRNRGGLNANVIREVSGGSIIGLVSGAAIAYLSKPLAILLGLFIVGVQYLEYNGIHIVPYTRLQRYFKSIDLKSAVQDNPAFKISFGLMFALAGFGRL